MAYCRKKTTFAASKGNDIFINPQINPQNQ